jgi:hypothetical protein
VLELEHLAMELTMSWAWSGTTGASNGLDVLANVSNVGRREESRCSQRLTRPGRPKSAGQRACARTTSRSFAWRKGLPVDVLTFAAHTVEIDANGRLPCIERKVTSTVPVLCSMKTISTTSASAARQIPNHAAPVRVCGDGVSPVVSVGGATTGG